MKQVVYTIIVAVKPDEEDWSVNQEVEGRI
jgi:hypothetical protein